ncbi:MAG TPA: hypothetical protein VFM54_23520 [Micromonosporaceae bacterium]|nr:hypothetical protein [Micromonosporaceae bacterium]
MPEQVTLLAVLVGRDESTHARIVERFEKCARDNDEDAALSVRTLRRWIAGQVRTEPRPSQRRVARLFWGYPMSQLLAPPRPSWSSRPELASWSRVRLPASPRRLGRCSR